ncbi:hypothetical protein E2C01_014918 [Portunus trituberculatus]|uniref:Uncharacterized protein n=1 Tax=Portunus trituberculatus TaxID=210409 RepID=A0A5B7DL75_PORTR|nr:hypothetical protein [Portunus trituberculatus]
MESVSGSEYEGLEQASSVLLLLLAWFSVLLHPLQPHPPGPSSTPHCSTYENIHSKLSSSPSTNYPTEKSLAIRPRHQVL